MASRKSKFYDDDDFDDGYDDDEDFYADDCEEPAPAPKPKPPKARPQSGIELCRT